MSKYFTMAEMTRSTTGAALKLNNTPTAEAQRNLEELMAVLDLIREAWGSPIRVTSGYRSSALNKAVGGASTSAHQNGSAADLQPAKGTQKEFNAFVRGFVLGRRIKIDQLILEKGSGKEWLHLGLRNLKGEQRGQIFSLNV